MKPPCCIGFAYVWFGLCYVWICFSFDANSLYLVSLLFGRRSGPVLPSVCIITICRYQTYPSSWAISLYASICVHVSSVYCIEGLVSPYVFYNLFVIVRVFGTYCVNSLSSFGQSRHVVIILPFPFILVSTCPSLLFLPFEIRTHWIIFHTKDMGDSSVLWLLTVVLWLWIYSLALNIPFYRKGFGFWWDRWSPFPWSSITQPMHSFVGIWCVPPSRIRLSQDPYCIDSDGVISYQSNSCFACESFFIC